MQAEHLDVLIVGAGLSGVAAAYYLQTRCPGRRYAILEARDAIGGTWDLFRYPGVRSDSDMYTLGYTFRPWPGAQAIADGPSILRYVRETAAAYGIDRAIRFGHRAVRAAWSAADARWTVEVERGPGREPTRITCGFLFMCSGYYDYAAGYTPSWPGLERFAGPVVHPQRWPADLDYAGRRVVVIGSGATAVTLVPALAERAAHVTMLQRSPTYVVAQPSEDAAARLLRRLLPVPLAARAARWKFVLVTMLFYQLARRRPAATRRTIMRMARRELGPGFDVGTHFAPRYDPWDQRLCLAPDGDLFAALRSGRASVVTDEIASFGENGLRLRSGAELPADIVVTATGLVLKLMGGMRLVVDGAPVDLARTLSYKGMLFSDVPNLAMAFGYTNASWTLKCELTAAYVCRLLNYMARRGYVSCVPRRRDPSLAEQPVLSFTSGYVRRALATLPRQGSKPPWKLYQNYLLDLLSLRLSPVDDGTLEFTRG
ncbi:MAG TPA: NAD(P)/FAD-dependent oxidoreductase [Chloroflexaceae bacterium]|nr:NAD(P)/FAD-dependent oxidoreductase [Chloroflexaceae bacterium]